MLEHVLRQPGPAVIAAGRFHRNGAGYLEAAARGCAYRLVAGIACVPFRASPCARRSPTHGRASQRSQKLESILSERSLMYAQADLHLDTDSLGVHGVVDALSNDESTHAST